MTHHEERYGARDHCLHEGGDIVKDLAGWARVSSLGGFCYRAAPSPLVERENFNAFGREMRKQVAISVDVI
jgi:hypothetical protein